MQLTALDALVKSSFAVCEPCCLGINQGTFMRKLPLTGTQLMPQVNLWAPLISWMWRRDYMC